jgi:predicted kinase
VQNAGTGKAVECVIFVGLPASGKSTFYVTRLAGSHRLISKDLWPSSSDKAARQVRELRQALGAGESVVIDNTSPTLDDRRAIIEIAHAFGARVIGYYFATAPRDAVGRNRARTGKARVPDVAIFAIAKRLVVPTREEGFDELYEVAIAGEGEFTVREM